MKTSNRLTERPQTDESVSSAQAAISVLPEIFRTQGEIEPARRTSLARVVLHFVERYISRGPHSWPGGHHEHRNQNCGAEGSRSDTPRSQPPSKPHSKDSAGTVHDPDQHRAIHDRA